MATPKPLTRAEQIQSLASTVADFGDGYFTVAASDDSGWKYLCYPDAKFPSCDCQDHRRKRTLNPAYLCKHLEAVKVFLAALRAAKPPSTKRNLFSMQQHITRMAKRQEVSLARLDEIPKGLAFW